MSILSTSPLGAAKTVAIKHGETDAYEATTITEKKQTKLNAMLATVWCCKNLGILRQLIRGSNINDASCFERYRIVFFDRFDNWTQYHTQNKRASMIHYATIEPNSTRSGDRAFFLRPRF